MAGKTAKIHDTLSRLMTGVWDRFSELRKGERFPISGTWAFILDGYAVTVNEQDGRVVFGVWNDDGERILKFDERI